MRISITLVLLLSLYSLSASAQQAAEFFEKNCKLCHTIGGGRLVGPDLKDVTKRKERAWLERFIQNPKAMMDSGDAYAAQLREDARGIVMPTLGVTPQMAQDLIEMIEEKSEQAASASAPAATAPAAPAAIPDEHPASASAPQAAEFFQKNCKTCHTIGGGRLVGPDLKDVTKRKDRAWLERFIQNPKAMMDSGDAYAMQLKEDARGIVMPMLGVTPAMASSLLQMIDEKSGHATAGAAETGISDRPFTAADLALGTAIFRGERKLSGGGPACISCHTLGSIGGMGGGRLGPDLTLVYERLGGRKAIGAWLSEPATPTMQAVFRQHALKPEEEIVPLLAVFENAARNSQPADATTQVNFLVAGFAGLCVGLSFMGWAWRERLRNVRRKMVSIARSEK